MKKISFVLVGMMLLAGCGAVPTAATTKPASEAAFTGTSTDDATKQTTTIIETQESAAVTAPSFADGDIYLDAIAAKDPSKCSAIKDAKLKKDCATAASAE